MINRSRFEQQLVCDDCGDEGETFDNDDFRRMIANAKDDGWSIRLVRGEWTHTCRQCVESSKAGGDFDEVEM